MARHCEICGKGIQFGNNVSHAHNVTKKVWQPNLQHVRIVQSNGSKKRIRVCTTCIRMNRVQKPSNLVRQATH